MYGQVYLITNKINGKRYVGQTTRPLIERWREHVKGHPSFPTAVNRAIQKYGRENFTMETLVCSESLEQLNKDEHFYILLLGTIGSHAGYNSRFGEGLGKMPDHVRAKISASNMGKTHTPEARAKLSQSLRGRKLTPEHRENISKAQMGGKRSPEACENIRQGKLGSRNPEYRADVSTEAIQALHEAGVSFSAIARQFGMSRTGIQYRLGLRD